MSIKAFFNEKLYSESETDIFYAVRNDEQGLPVVETLQAYKVDSFRYKMLVPLKYPCTYNPYDKLQKEDHEFGTATISERWDRGWVFMTREYAILRIKFMAEKLERELETLSEKTADFANRLAKLKLEGEHNG